jgi:hypothetical protein
MENIVYNTQQHNKTQSHTTSLRMYGLYDGHGGDEVSTLLSERMLPLIRTQFQEHNVQEKEEQAEHRKNMFQTTFQQMDKDILNIQMATISSTHHERLSPSSHTSNKTHRHSLDAVRQAPRLNLEHRPTLEMATKNSREGEKAVVEDSGCFVPIEPMKGEIAKERRSQSMFNLRRKDSGKCLVA